jgi:hypothetical protein
MILCESLIIKNKIAILSRVLLSKAADKEITGQISLKNKAMLLAARTFIGGDKAHSTPVADVSTEPQRTDTEVKITKIDEIIDRQLEYNAMQTKTTSNFGYKTTPLPRDNSLRHRLQSGSASITPTYKQTNTKVVMEICKPCR